jgi:hypothetical protein
MAAGTTATSRIRWVQREQTQLLRPTCLALAGLYCVVYACKTFLRVRNGDPWLDVANRQGVLGGSWTRLGREARWTSQMPCRCVAICVAIGLKGASEVLLLLSGGKPGHAATSTRGQNRYIDGPECPRRHDGRVICLAVVWRLARRGPAKRCCFFREANQGTLRPQHAGRIVT